MDRKIAQTKNLNLPIQSTIMYYDKTCSRSRMTLGGALKYKMLELIVKIVLVLAVVNLALLFGNLFYFDR